MNRFLTSAGTILLGLAVAGLAHAHHGPGHAGGSSGHGRHPSGGSHHGGHHSIRHRHHGGYHRPGHYRKHGPRFRHGHHHRGRHHHHWSAIQWDKRYRCRLYYDSGLRCWYYWCRPDQSYYPVSYCPYGRHDWPDEDDDDEDGDAD